MAPELTAARQAMMKTSYKLDVVLCQAGDIRKQVTGMRDQLRRMEIMLQRIVYSQRRTTEPALGRCTPNLRQAEEPRHRQDLVHSGELEVEMTKRVEDLRQINVRSTPEGNFKFPTTYPSVVVTGWEQDQVPNGSVRRIEWENPKDTDEGDFGIPSWLFGFSLPDAVERAKDLAVLKEDAPTDLLKPINVGLSSVLRIGQQCLAIGNPFGFDHILTVEFTVKDKYFCPALAQAVNTMNIEQMEQTKVKANLCSVDYQPRRVHGKEIREQDVYGIDPYTHNCPKEIMPADLDWSIDDKHAFIEGSGDRRIAKMCLGMLKAMRSHHEYNYVAYRKGIGVVCNKKGGLGVDDRWLWSTGLLWNLPPWPDLNFYEVDWMANGMEKDVYNAVTWQSKIYSQQAKSKPFIEAGVKNETVSAASGTPSTDLIASGNNTPQRCFSPTKSGTGTFEYQNHSPGVATPHPEFCCQISRKLMSEPVIIASGQTYESEKLSQFCHVPVANIFSLYDVSNIGHIPLLLWDQKAHVAILKDPSLKSIAWAPNLEEWVARAILYGTLQDTDVLNSTDKIKEDPKSNIDIALYNFHQENEVLELRNFHRKSRTSLEENKDFPIVWNSVIAGRYRVTKYLGSAAFSKVVQEHLFIVTELLRVNLYEFQKESGDELYFSLLRIQAVAQQCLEALVYLHHLNIVHCDLTPENILMKSYSRYEIKVIDLGNSCFLTENLSLNVQSCSYRTPEVIPDLPYDQKIDIWSLGCILAELYIGFPVQWYDGPVYSNRHQRSTASSTSYGSNSSPVENQSQRPTTNLMGMQMQILPSGMGLTSPSYTTRMYPDSRFYGQYGPHGNTLTAILGYGSNVYNSRNNGHWGVVDTKYKPRGRAPFVFGCENQDGFIELNRRPRSGGFKHQKPFGPTVTIAMKGQAIHTIGKQENSVLPDNRQFKQEDFHVTYKDAKFFIIKSYHEDDGHKCVKYNVWASTPNGNKKLDAGYREAQEKLSECPVFLFFFVNTSVQFVGVAEMVGPVDFDKTVDYWQQDKWNGGFPVKWHIVKDVPNNILKHITLDNYDNKPVTHYRDTQEVKLEQCLEMFKIFKDHVSKTSIMAGLFNSGRTAAAKKLFKSLKVLYKIQLPDGVGIHPGFPDSPLKIHCSPKANSSSDLSLVSKDSKLKTEPISVLEISVVTQWLIPWKNLLSDPRKSHFTKDASWNDADFINGAFPGFYSHTINSWFPEDHT